MTVSLKPLCMLVKTFLSLTLKPSLWMLLRLAPEQQFVKTFSWPLFRPWKRRTARFRRTKTICFASNVTWGAAWNSYLPKWKPSIRDGHSRSVPPLQSVPVTAPTPNQVGQSNSFFELFHPTPDMNLGGHFKTRFLWGHSKSEPLTNVTFELSLAILSPYH